MFRSEAVKVSRPKDDRILIEGRWANIRRLVQGLTDDGWKVIGEPTGEPSGFKFTEVELKR